jgi:hypothetical protein
LIDYLASGSLIMVPPSKAAAVEAMGWIDPPFRGRIAGEVRGLEWEFSSPLLRAAFRLLGALSHNRPVTSTMSKGEGRSASRILKHRLGPQYRNGPTVRWLSTASTDPKREVEHDERRTGETVLDPSKRINVKQR